MSPWSEVRVPDRIADRLLASGQVVEVSETGWTLVVDGTTGATLRMKRTHPRNVNQWTVIGPSA